VADDYDSHLRRPVWAPAWYRHFPDVDWAKHGFDQLPMVLVPKENHAYCNQLNSSPTKNILSLKVAVHVPQILLPVRAQTDLIGFQNKKRQT
jgi:hypothetical protein